MATSFATASIITGGSGNDALLGTSGNDTIDAGGGSDAVNAGAGNDTMIYRLGANAAATDLYMGGSGIDTVLIQLTQTEWSDPGVRAELQRYVSFLTTLSLNSKGEASGSAANNFAFHFPNGAALMLQTTERLAVAVQNSSGQYELINHLASSILGPVTGSVTEACGLANAVAGTPSATGDLFADDLNGADDVFQPIASGVATYGSYSLTSDGVWTYNLNNDDSSVQALNAGDTLTDTFTVYTQDGTAQVVTITINGANDAALITGTTAASVDEAGGVNNSEGTSTVSGTLYSSDVDNAPNAFLADPEGTENLGTPSGGTSTTTDPYSDPMTGSTGTGGSADYAPVADDGTGGTSTGIPGGAGSAMLMTWSDQGYGTYAVDAQGHWIYTVDNNDSNVQALNVGDTLTDTFTVHAVDGTAQVITVTINGANDAAVIIGDSVGAVLEAGESFVVDGVWHDGTGWAMDTGRLYCSDDDNAQNVFRAADAGSSDQGYGTFTVSTQGQWTYTLNDYDSRVQALNVNETLTDSFTVLAEDGTEQEVIITIAGANDAALISGQDTGTVTEAGTGTPGVPIVSGDLLSTDIDNAVDVFQAATGVASYGTYAVTADGEWVYTLDNANAAVDALNSASALSDSFSVASQDGTLKTVNISIEGTNDVVNHSPTDIALKPLDIGDGPLMGTFAILSTADPDSGDSHTYSVDRMFSTTPFQISGDSVSPYTDPTGQWNLRIRSTDAAGSTISKTFTVFVGNGSADNLAEPSNDTLAYGGGDADSLQGSSGDDYLFGQGGDDLLRGGIGNDWLAGGSGSDSLIGNDGNDWIVGGAGSDALTGNDGNDMFVLNAPMDGSNVDGIGDFTTGVDKIVLENTGAGLFNALDTGALDPGAFVDVGSGAAITAATRIIYNHATGELQYDADGSGGGASVLIALIGTDLGSTNHSAIYSTDFLVI